MSGAVYGIVGCGAVGGYYGGCLQRSGADVHFLAHSDYDHIRHQGLVVESKNGDFVLPDVNVYTDTASMPPCDVVIVALKTTSNHLLSGILPAVVKPHGVVCMLQNGLGNEALAASMIGADRVLGGLCFVCSNKIGPGHIRHIDYGLVQLGAHVNGNVSAPWLQRVVADFEKAGLPVQQTPDLQSARWQKLVWNIPYNGLSVLLDASTNQLMADPHSRRLVRELMEEVVKAAGACGSSVAEHTVQQMLDRTTRMAPYQTSMKIDFDAKRPMEVEAIFGNPLRAAEAAGVSVAQIRTLYELLKFLDDQNLDTAASRDLGP